MVIWLGLAFSFRVPPHRWLLPFCYWRPRAHTSPSTERPCFQGMLSLLQKSMREGWEHRKVLKTQDIDYSEYPQICPGGSRVIITQPGVELISMQSLKSALLCLALQLLLNNFLLYPLTLFFHLILCPISSQKFIETAASYNPPLLSPQVKRLCL